MAIKKIQSYLLEQTPVLPLAIFRIAFGLAMSFSMFRFMYKGWIEACYINTPFHFTYQYFNWVKPFDITTMYILVALCGVSALFIGLGFLYRISAVLFFFLFTYLELIEKSWYLNHYYFVSLIAFLLIFIPANKFLSFDAIIWPKLKVNSIFNWAIVILKLQISFVYFFGGIAKLKYDWLINAQPLFIWMKAKIGLPLIGWLFEYDFMPYFFSWSGMIYDLMIPFLLWSKKCRPFAFILVIVFHTMTYAMFNIGLFPWIMILSSLIFITQEEWKNVFDWFNVKLDIKPLTSTSFTHSKSLSFLAFYIVLQCLIPLRHFILTDNVLWTEKGIRFAWHVMVMEKNGYAEFTVLDNESNKRWIEYPSNYLTTIQERQMSFQPDMIWQYAQFLKEKYKLGGVKNCSVYVNSKVSLNGRSSQTYIDASVDLAAIESIDDIYDYVVDLKRIDSTLE